MIPEKYISCTLNEVPFVSIESALKHIKAINPEIVFNFKYALGFSRVFVEENKVVVILCEGGCKFEEKLFIDGVEIKLQINDISLLPLGDKDSFKCKYSPFKFVFLSFVSEKIKEKLDDYDGLKLYSNRNYGFTCSDCEWLGRGR